MNETLILALANGVMGLIIYKLGVWQGRRQERVEFFRNPFRKVGR